MSRRALAALVFLAPAFAAARPYKPSQDFCVREPAKPAVFVRDKLAIACFSPTAQCLQLPGTPDDADDRKVVLHPPPPDAVTVAHTRDEAGVLEACSADLGTCKKLGKHATAALRQTAATSDPLGSDLGEREIAVTPDLAALVTVEAGALELWSVAKDRVVKARGPAKATLAGFELVGGSFGALVMARWSNGTSTLVDPATGRARGAAFPSGHAVVLGERIAIVPEGGEGKLSVIAAKTGKLAGTTELAPKVAASAVTTDGDDLVVMWSETGDGYRVARVQIGDKAPVVSPAQTIEACKP